MDTKQLTDLAEHYAGTMVLNFATNSRTDLGLDLDDEPAPFDAVDIIEAFVTLTESAQEAEGQTLAVNGVVSVIRGDGHEYMIPLDKLRAEDIDSAKVALAASFHAIYAEAHAVMSTFAGLDRMKQHLKDKA